MIKKITLILFLIIAILYCSTEIKADSNKNLVNIYFIHSNTCSHCKEESKFLVELEKRYDNIKIYKYEIHNEDNLEILRKIEDIYNDKFNSVPITIIGNKLYTGYTESYKINFIKTIEYFSRYGYQDKLGEAQNVKLPTYKMKNSNPTLDQFISNYHSYKLLGLKTDKLDPNNISILIGILLSFNIITLLGILSIVILLNKVKEEKIKILSILLYVPVITILLLSSLLKNNIFTGVIYLVLMLLIIYNLKKNKYKVLNYIIIISIIVNLVTTITNKNILIFKNILKLHYINGINLIYYYGNCLIIYLIINFIIIYIGHNFNNLILKKYKKM